MPFRPTMTFFTFLTAIFLTASPTFAYETIFDRLDGTGPSKKRVDVVEWDGNLEIHVYPKGSLKGMGVKLDDREKGKKVMVISYDLKDTKEPLVRRAILGIPFNPKIKAFVDSSESDFDKIGLSNRDLGKPWSSYKLQAPPQKWGPDGSKYDEDSTPEQMTEMRRNDRMDSYQSRKPASYVQKSAQKQEQQPYVHPAKRVKKQVKAEHNEGGVQEYEW